MGADVPAAVRRKRRGQAEAVLEAIAPDPLRLGRLRWNGEPAEVIAEAMLEAERHDPERVKRWVVLVDGAETQLDLVEARDFPLGLRPAAGAPAARGVISSSCSTRSRAPSNRRSRWPA